jgi:signal transduction histidine kinase
MSTTAPASLTRTPLEGWRSPLSMAAYITWLSVANGPWVYLFHRAAPPTPLEWAGIAAEWLLLGFFLLRAVGDGRVRDSLRQKILVMAQAASGLIACWAFDDGALPVLLIIVASQAALVFQRRGMILFLLPMNAALAVVLVYHRAGGSPLAIAAQLGSYLGFQAFAVLVASYAKKLEQARDEALKTNAQLLATRALLAQGSRADERLNLSRELHDVTGHKLTALKLQLALLARRAPEHQEPLAQLQTLADELLQDVRGVVSTLRHHEGIALIHALQALCAAFPQPVVTLTVEPDLRVPSLAKAETLLRVAQEGLTNAARHSGAQNVALRLEAEREQLLLTVADDGHGLGNAPRGNGLTGMAERLVAVGGGLHLAATPGGGLTLTAWVPA